MSQEFTVRFNKTNVLGFFPLTKFIIGISFTTVSPYEVCSKKLLLYFLFFNAYTFGPLFNEVAKSSKKVRCIQISLNRDVVDLRFRLRLKICQTI